MPANSTDVLVQIEDSLRSNLGRKDKRHSLEQKLLSSSKRILLHSIAFQPATQTMSFQEQLRAKYTPLNPSSHKAHHNHSNGEHKEGSPRDTNDGLPIPKVVIYSPDRVRLEWPKQRMHARIGPGLQNLGNTCFLNSVLQCLTHTPPFVNYFYIEDHISKCKVVTSCMMCEFQRHVKRCFDSQGGQNHNRIIKPMSFIHKLKLIAKHLQFGRQEDAHEFLRCLIENMAKSNLHGYPKDLDRFSKETTVVNQIFGGFLRSQVVCMRCKGRSNTFDPFMDISLDIKNVQTIQRAFEKFVQVEYLDGDNAYSCAKCKQKVPAQKRFTIHKSSNVLTIQLKRFEISRFHGKITKHVGFPDRLDVRPYMSQRQGEPIMYNLYGVLVHHGGTTSSGHYFAYVKSSTQSWYQMNDQMVRQSSPQAVANQEAYLLFYVRQKMTPSISQVPKSGITSPKTTSSSTATDAKTKPHALGQPSHETGSPLKRKEIGPQVYPSHNGKGPQSNVIPVLSQREKISFGIKPKPTQSEENKPRIVMHIKHGKIAYNSAAEKAAAAKEKAAALGAAKLHKLVPYDDNNSDSDASEKERPKHATSSSQPRPGREEPTASTSSAKHMKPDKFEPVMEAKLNTTTTVPGAYGPLNKDAKAESRREKDRKDDWSSVKPSPVKRTNSSHVSERYHDDTGHVTQLYKRSMSEHTGLSVITSPDRRVNATTRGWSVLDPEAQVSPSIASESSSIASVNSTTEWHVIDRNQKKPSPVPEAQHYGWTVTPSRTVSSPAIDEVSDSLQITLKKTSPTSSKGEERLSNGQDAGAKSSYRNDSAAVKKSSSSLFGACMSRGDVTSTPYGARSSKNSDSVFDSPTAQSQALHNGNGIHSTSSASSPALNGVSDSVSEESLRKKSKKHKKHKKKHKKHKHRDSDNDEEEESHKKKKKHKKYKSEDREPLLGSDDSDSPKQSLKRKFSSEDEHAKKKPKYEWVEKTIETISKTSDPPKSTVPVHQWDYHVKDGRKKAEKEEKPKSKPWDGTRHDNKQTLKELHRSSQVFGGKVNSWEGGSSSLDQDSTRDKKEKSWEDEYEEELDKGKVKKLKSNSQGNNAHGGKNGHLFQRFQSDRNQDNERRKSGILSPNGSSSRSSSTGSSDRPHPYPSKSYHGNPSNHHGNNNHHSAHRNHGYHGHHPHHSDHHRKHERHNH